MPHPRSTPVDDLSALIRAHCCGLPFAHATTMGQVPIEITRDDP